MAEEASGSPSSFVIRNKLECAICHKRIKDPKILQCLHNFCEKCLETKLTLKYFGTVTCPLCGHSTPISSNGVQNLKTNFHLIGQLEDTLVKEELLSVEFGQPACDLCDLEKEAVSRCLDCSMYLCLSCKTLHHRIVLSKHTVATFDELRLGEVTKTFRRQKRMEEGPNNVRYFCETCDDVICKDCPEIDPRSGQNIFLGQRGASQHKIMNMESAASTKRNITKLMIYNLRKRLSDCKLTLSSIATERAELEGQSRELEEQVKEAIRKIAETIVSEGSGLLKEIAAISQEQEKFLQEKEKNLKAAMQHMSDSFETAIDVAFNSSDQDFLGLVSLIHNNLEDLISKRPDTIYRRLPQWVLIRENSRSIGYLQEKKKVSARRRVCRTSHIKQVRRSVRQTPQRDKQDDDDVIFISEKLPTADQRLRAERLLLPPTFFLYEDDPPCPGCRGCEEEDLAQRGIHLSKHPRQIAAGKSAAVASAAITPTTVFGSAAFGQKTFGSVDGSWQCDVCWLNNEETTLTCISCTTPKPSAAPPSATQQLSTLSKLAGTSPQNQSVTSSGSELTFGSSDGFSFAGMQTSDSANKPSGFGSLGQPSTLSKISLDSSLFAGGPIQFGSSSSDTKLMAPKEKPAATPTSKFKFEKYDLGAADNLSKQAVVTVTSPSAGFTFGTMSLTPQKSDSATAASSKSQTQPQFPVKQDHPKEVFPTKPGTGFVSGALAQTRKSSAPPAFSKPSDEKSSSFSFADMAKTMGSLFSLRIDVSKIPNEAPQKSPAVEIPKYVEARTGEEGEEVRFTHRAKLFRFNKESTQWKERGIGDIKLLYKPDNKKYRIVMRREQVFKVCANHFISPDLKLQPNAGSRKSWVWMAMDASEDEVQMEQLAVRFQTEELAQRFKEAVEAAQEDMKTAEGDEVKINDQNKIMTDKAQIENKDVPGDVQEMDNKAVEKDEVVEEDDERGEDGKDARIQEIPQTSTLSAFSKPCQENSIDFSFSDMAKTKASLFSFQMDISKTPHETPQKISVVEIPKCIDARTGEEGEEVRFTHRAKLFRFNKESTQWKERGIGDIKLLYKPDNKKYRIVMRREQVFKVCANHFISPDLKLQPNAGSRKSWVWMAMDASEDEVQMEQLAVRFQTEELAQRFKEAVEAAQEDMKTAEGDEVKIKDQNKLMTDKAQIENKDVPGDVQEMDNKAVEKDEVVEEDDERGEDGKDATIQVEAAQKDKTGEEVKIKDEDKKEDENEIEEAQEENEDVQRDVQEEDDGESSKKDDEAVEKGDEEEDVADEEEGENGDKQGKDEQDARIQGDCEYPTVKSCDPNISQGFSEPLRNIDANHAQKQ